MSLLFFPCPAFQHPGRTVPSFLRLVSLFHGSCCSHLSLLLEQVLSSSEMTSVLFLCHAIIFGGIPRVMGCQVFGIPWPLLTLDSSLTIRFPVGSVCNLPEGCWAASADVILQPDATSCQPVPRHCSLARQVAARAPPCFLLSHALRIRVLLPLVLIK